MNAPTDWKLVGAAENAFFELFGKTLRPYASLMAGRFVK